MQSRAEVPLNGYTEIYEKSVHSDGHNKLDDFLKYVVRKNQTLSVLVDM